MEGQATVTSDGSDSTVTSETVDVGSTESEEETTANAVTGIGSILTNTINIALQAIATGQVPNFIDGAQQSDFLQ